MAKVKIDLVQKLRTWNGRALTHVVLNQAADEIERLRAVIEAVANLHDPDHTTEPRCLSCGDWPCPTHLIVSREYRGSCDV